LLPWTQLAGEFKKQASLLNYFDINMDIHYTRGVVERLHTLSKRGILVKVRDIIKQLEADGWYLVSMEGSHRHYKHPIKRGKVTVPGHRNDDLTFKTLASIKRQAGW
jgi:predicted RNA binding protein YcfA (HicA-like mRNA interferase family)